MLDVRTSVLAPPEPARVDAPLIGDNSRAQGLARYLAPALTAIAFVLLFAHPAAQLARDWWEDPDAGHGLLLAPVAVWLAWRAGLQRDAKPNFALGLPILVLAVIIRYVSGLAAELFTMRGSMILAIVALIVCYAGIRQVLHWWLPLVLLALSVPLPDLITGAISLPLQFKASQLGAALLKTRDIPVLLDGNVIRLPGHNLFVAEACSGLRSLTALLALGVLLGGLMLRSPIARILLLVLAVPVAIAINGVRVFLTGFLVFFVDPKLAEGFMHVTEGWLLFLVSLSALGVLAWVARRAERLVPRWRSEATA